MVGCYLIAELLQDVSCTMVCAVRSEKAQAQLLADVSVLSGISKKKVGETLSFVYGDISDFQFLEENMDETTIVIHAAASVSFNPKDKEMLFETNIEGTANVVNACLHRKVKKMVYVSSVAAIGRTETEDFIDESTAWQESKRNSIYAISKHHGELEVWRGIEEGLDAIMVNPTVVLGYTSQGNSSSSIFHNIKKGFAFSSDGINGFVGANDVAKAIVLLSKSEVKGERYVLCSENLKFSTLFSQIAMHLGKKEPRIMVKSWMKWIALPIAKIHSLLSGKAPFVTKEVFDTSLSINQYSAKKIESDFGFSFTPIVQIVDDVASKMS